MKYTFLFRTRPVGAIGVFDQHRCVEVQAEPDEPLLDVVLRASDECRTRYPGQESGGIAGCACEGKRIYSVGLREE